MPTNSWILLSTHIFYLFIYFIFLHQCLHIHRTCLNKNAPILASCSFDKHRLILIIFDKQHQHSFEDYVPTKLSLALHFYLFYLLLNSSDGNDAKRIGRLLAPDGSEKSRFTNQIKKRPSNWCSFALSHACNRFLQHRRWRFCDTLTHVNETLLEVAIDFAVVSQLLQRPVDAIFQVQPLLGNSIINWRASLYPFSSYKRLIRTLSSLLNTVIFKHDIEWSQDRVISVAWTYTSFLKALFAKNYQN